MSTDGALGADGQPATAAGGGGAALFGAPSLEALVRRLDRELAASMLREEGSTAEAADTSELMIRFSVGEIVFGVTVDQMVEIEAVPALTFVPRVAPAVCGLANLRGEVIVVLDLARHLDPGSSTSGDATARRMIVVRDACLGRPGGVLVDRVFGIGPFDRKQMSGPVDTLPKPVTPFVIGSLSVAEQDIAVIDLQAFARSTEAGTPWHGA